MFIIYVVQHHSNISTRIVLYDEKVSIIVPYYSTIPRTTVRELSTEKTIGSTYGESLIRFNRIK